MTMEVKLDELGTEVEDRLDKIKERIIHLEQMASPDPRRKWLVGLLTTILLGWLGWASTMLIGQAGHDDEIDGLAALVSSVERRIAIREANAFTAQDGLRQQATLAAHEQLAGHAPMVERMVAEQETRARVERRLERMEIKLDRLIANGR